MKDQLRRKAQRVVVASVMTMALASGLTALSVTAASAAGGTGITATPARTVVFDSGAYSAQFVRAASGIINETNRVEIGVSSGNGFGPFDVLLQFRPLTGPLGTGSPTPNSACDSDTVVAPFVYINTDPTIDGTPSTGYFINSNPYEVCVYYTQSFALTLLGNGTTPTTVYVGQHVIYTGTYTYGSSPIVGYPVTLTVWSGYGCTGSPLYTGISAGATDINGNYSYDGGPSPFGTYSVMANTAGPANQSNCLNINVLPNYSMTLLANGGTNTAVTSGGAITYTGTLTYDGVGLSGQSVTMNIYTLPGCTGPQYSGFPDSGVATTSGSGDYTWGPNASTQAGPTGTFYLKTSSGSADSNCITVTVSS